ncbi:hypothetical protein IC235_16560 [Hymenobacter sp. BT664]|uniref:Uncharacterized protein n=1 Tax=Hymenobacter montanus TaxID=2771359 RepID=A0A927BGD0_9BACT|nr:hypothetical protein [Hymenobacter montanus]MBD2769502.1 hypothetical protein [Hymenobacter montanus]
MSVLTIQDETATGGVLHRLELEIAQEMLTVRELIEQRVRQEVAAYNAQQSDVFQGLVQPSESERVLNGYRRRRFQPIDAEQQLYKALEGFQQNRYFVLVNERQVETLDEEVWLGEGATASFIKLTPLVGG